MLAGRPHGLWKWEPGCPACFTASCAGGSGQGAPRSQEAWQGLRKMTRVGLTQRAAVGRTVRLGDPEQGPGRKCGIARVPVGGRVAWGGGGGRGGSWDSSRGAGGVAQNSAAVGPNGETKARVYPEGGASAPWALVSPLGEHQALGWVLLCVLSHASKSLLPGSQMRDLSRPGQRQWDSNLGPSCFCGMPAGLCSVQVLSSGEPLPAS